MAEITAGELAERLGLRLRGDGTRVLTGAAVLEEAGPWQLAFAGSPKFFGAAALSEAGCVIAPPEYEGRTRQNVIESLHARAHFAAALGFLFPPAAVSAGVHPSAVVDPGAMVDESAEIGPFVRVESGAIIRARVRIAEGCSIGEETEIGEDTVLRTRVTVYERVRIGARCLLHAGAVIGADGFGFELTGDAYRKVPQVGTVEIGDDVEIGANTCIDRATLGATVIGDGTKLDNMVHIAHNCRIGRHVVIAAQTGLAGGVSIGDYAVVGGQVGVGDKARIEARAIVGSGAGILTSKIVRAGEPVWGTPARPLRRYLEQLAALSRIAKKRG